MGLILVPLVEKTAEHLTAVDEAWDDQMNFALAHILGATAQTAMFNSSLVVIVGWGLNKAMDLNFEIFNIVVYIKSTQDLQDFIDSDSKAGTGYGNHRGWQFSARPAIKLSGRFTMRTNIHTNWYVSSLTQFVTETDQINSHGELVLS